MAARGGSGRLINYGLEFRQGLKAINKVGWSEPLKILCAICQTSKAILGKIGEKAYWRGADPVNKIYLLYLFEY